MLKLLIVCASLALALAQHAGYDDAPEAEHAAAPGVERPYGFPYVHPYVHAGHYGFPGYYHHPYPYYHGHPGYYGHGYIFYGNFKGSCYGARDGLYYVDAHSFAFCSNGIKSIQACAEGSANPGYDFYHPGHYYTYGDFCSVNLSDKGH